MRPNPAVNPDAPSASLLPYHGCPRVRSVVRLAGAPVTLVRWASASSLTQPIEAGRNGQFPKAGWVWQAGAILKSEAYERQAARHNPPASKQHSPLKRTPIYLLLPPPSFKKSPSLPSDNKPL